MKLGIIGLPQSGRTTIFETLTGLRGEGQEGRLRGDKRIASIKVVDERLIFLSDLLKPKKTTFAVIEYILPTERSGAEIKNWGTVRECDALIHVIRNFKTRALPEPSSEKDFWKLEEEMIFNDLVIADKRIQRMESESQKGKKIDEKEYEIVKRCKELLEDNRPIRIEPEISSSPIIRGYGFLTAKPMLLIINNDDENEDPPEWKIQPEKIDMMVLRAKLERDISALEPDEAEEFKIAYNIKGSTLDRIIKRSYQILNLISFFTVVNQEARAWSITKGTTALDAAGTVHSDMKKGFIRAEVISFDDLKKTGSFNEARKAGKFRLEGKDYIVQDGDIIQFRFNI